VRRVYLLMYWLNLIFYGVMRGTYRLSANELPLSFFLFSSKVEVSLYWEDAGTMKVLLVKSGRLLCAKDCPFLSCWMRLALYEDFWQL
jgi:hypothetical protein